MIEYSVYAFLANLAYCMIGVGALLVVLRVFDRMLGISFRKDIWNEIVGENNSAVAIYTGLRFVGCCILLGCIIS